MRTLSEWLTYIESAHPSEIDMSLTRMRKVFSNLQLNFSHACVITVAGTNGKGTSCRFIEQACLLAGKTVGVYASPHIEKFNERIRLNGADIDDVSICDAFQKIYQATLCDNEVISLTYFEYATLCAFVIFTEQNLEICLLEVGLGGRLDATNIVDANIGVITSIGLDHQEYLGDTTELIAAEKAGIIKPGQKVVVGYPNMHTSVQHLLAKNNASYKLSGQDFGLISDLSVSECVAMNLVNSGQETSKNGYLNVANESVLFNVESALIPPQNIMTSLAALQYIAEICKSANPLLVNAIEIQNLIGHVSMPGRMQVLQTKPYIVLDVAHNEDSAALLVKRLQVFDFAKCHIVIGMLKDKNVEATIARLSSLNAQWYCTDLPTVRGEKAKRLINAVQIYKQKASVFQEAGLALQQAIHNASENDMILIVGSFVLASQCIQHLKTQNKV